VRFHAVDMAMSPWLPGSMKSMAAWAFKNGCFEVLDEVERTKTTVVMTKRGRPMARLVPCAPPFPAKSPAGSVLKEIGDPFRTGERWDADTP